MKHTLHFELVGQGPPIVVLHGLFGSGDNWRTVLKPLSQHYSLLFLDQRNHGKSFWDVRHDYPSLKQDLYDLLTQLGIEKATFLAHSMGGKAAILFALWFPEATERLIIVDMGIKKYTPHHSEIFAGLKNVDLTTLQSRQDADLLLSAHIKDHASRQLLLKGLQRVKEYDGPGILMGEHWGWRFNLAALEANYAHILESVEQPGRHYGGPTVFIRGAKSKYVLDGDWPGIQPYFPQAQLVTIADAGHWVHAEQPAAFLAAVQEFLVQHA